MALVQRRDLYTALKVQPEYFSDFMTNFDNHIQKKDLLRDVNEEAIKSSIKNLLQTNRGERLFNPTVGSDINSMLFDNYSPSLDQVLEDQIRNTIDNFEPRARVQEVDVSFDEAEQYMSATITFTIINKQEPITLDLVLNRIR